MSHQQFVSLVSGANSGIGLETARALASRGDKVILLCRNQGRAQSAVENIKAQNPKAALDIVLCDLADQDSIRAAGVTLRSNYESIDVLVNNAGGVFGDYQKSRDGIEYTFALNHMGYFLLTHEVMPLLLASRACRVVSVASRAHVGTKFLYERLNHGKAGYDSWRAYSLSKLCNILFAKKLAQLYFDQQLTSNALHPGVVLTNFSDSGPRWIKFLWKFPFSRLFMINDKKGAQTSIYLATSDEVSHVTGQYFAKSRIKQPTPAACNQHNMDMLWDASHKLSYVETYGEPVDP